MLLDFIEGRVPLEYALAWLLGATIAITVHEYAHAWRADRAGDPTPRAAGRLSLYPWVHYDLIGTTLLLIARFGWAKPVPVNPLAFKRPREDGIMVGLWGPLANFITAAVLAIPIRLAILFPALGLRLILGQYFSMLLIMIEVNLILGLFNLIPIYPLDGSHILSGLLPVQQARKLEAFYHQWGMLLLILLVLSPVFRLVLGPLLTIALSLLTGIPMAF